MPNVRFLTVRAANSDSIISGSDPTEFSSSNPLRLFIIQAAIIIIFTRAIGFVFQKIKQPRVIAEVVGGILLGPTAIGRIPGFTKHIFPAPSLPYLNLVSTIGLVLFLFIVGLEVDVRVIRRCAKESTAISVLGLILPFGLGAAVSVGIYNEFINKDSVSFGHFILFTGVAMAITAFPVLARILTETKLLYTKVGVIVLAAGVGNDVVGWILLALTVALVNAATGLTALYVLLCTVGWALCLYFLVKPAFTWLARRTGSFENGPNQFMIMITLLLVLISAWITDIIGVHPIFGSFLVGLMVPHDGGFAIALTEKMEDLVAVVFLPIYFALSGLKTNLGDLNSGKAWGYTVAIIVIAYFSKFIGCAGAARAFGFNLRESAAIGTLMSCKGLVELIVLNIGLSAGILDTRVFSMFVLMAVISTIITTPLTLFIYPEQYRTSLDDDSSIHSRHGKPQLGGHTDAADREEASGSDGAAAAKKLLVILSSFEHLPGLMTLVQLMQPSLAAAEVATLPEADGLRRRHTKTGSSEKSADGDANGSDESVKEGDDAIQATPVLSSDAPYASYASRPQAAISINALRLVELTDRTSAVMKVSESEDTMRADPIINVFRTFGRLNGLPVSSSMAVIPPDEFAPTVANRCRNTGSNFIVLPMTLSQTGPDAQQPQGATSLPNPFDGLFGHGDIMQRNSPHHFNFVRRLIQTAETDVGLLIDRAGAGPLARVARPKHILLGFMGGPDDRAALELITRLCASNKSLTATVVRFQRISAEDAGESVLPAMPPTVHHEQALRISGGANADTVYPAHQHQSPLEATLEDDLVVNKVESEIETGRFDDRIRVQAVSTARPLRDLIKAVEAEQPAIVMVGRGRRQPTMTHRDELKWLLAHGTAAAAPEGEVAEPTRDREKERAIDSETSKVIGEPALALTLASSPASTLVIAAGFNAASLR
ncbi:K(+)/H(+) antiporter [Thecaphora frezii]